MNLGVDAYRAKVQVLERHCEAEGRDPATIARSMMAFAIVGPDEASLDAATRRLMGMFGAPAGSTPADYRQGLRERGMLVGGTSEVVDRLGEYAALGMEEVQMQHFEFDSDVVPEYLAAEIAYAATAEGALHLDDVLTRRTRISIETAHRGAETARHAAAVMGDALGWDEAVRAREVEHYLARVEAERQSQKMPDDLTADAARLGVADVRGYAADRGIDLLHVDL